MRTATLLSAALALSSALAAPAPFEGADVIGRGLKKSGKGAVATEAAPCSEIGAKVLEDGGNAVDAIISSVFCVGVISAYHSGIGGGGFAIVRYNKKDGSGHAYEQIDFRETMPAAGNETMYAADANGATLSTIGGLSVGVPGEIRGWELLHKRHGTYPWKKLFEPSIKLARGGFKINYDLAAAIVEGESFILGNGSDAHIWQEAYAPNGTLLVEGDTAYRKRYANTLEKIANEGADAFYKGSIAKNTVKATNETGGILTLKDLAGYTAIVREVVDIVYRKTRIFSTVAPSSGAVVLSALRIFSHFRGDYSDVSPAINVTTHRLIEATQFAYGQRGEYGDPSPEFGYGNVTELQKYYLRDDVAAELAAKINDTKTYGVSYYDPAKYTATNESGTSHLAVIDGHQQAVSLTTTVNYYWGSRVMTEDGIILNDEMDDFSSPSQVNGFGFAASPVNFIRPGKRPQSSISSSIAEDKETGDILIATGSAGGSRIITATLQHLYHVLDQKLTAKQSAHHPRWHDQLGGSTLFELPAPEVGIAGYNNATVSYLAGLGYNITYEDTTGSTGHVALRSKNGTYSAANDPRKRAGAGVAIN